MIFATVGTQLPFPRMIRALDEIAVRRGLDVVAQTCANEPSATHIVQQPFITPGELHDRIAAAHVIVGHAGIGTIITAAKVEKPLILYPRQAALGEHRNDHQQATAREMESRQGIYVAWNDDMLEQFLTGEPLIPFCYSESPTRSALIQAIGGFIKGA